MSAVKKCPLCDRPAELDQSKRWQGNKDYCERFSLALVGLSSSGGYKQCAAAGVNWRERYEQATAEAADLRAQLDAARRALSRHHGQQATRVDPFRDGARITT